MKHHLLEFSRYFAASGVALAVDLALYGTLIYLFDASYLVAAPIAFIAGLICVYLLSVRLVFATRRVNHPGVEFTLFAAIGIFGLLLTELLLYVFVEYLAASPFPAKLFTAGIVFCSNYAFRKLLLFR